MFLLFYLLACTQATPDAVSKTALPVLNAPDYHRVKGRHILVSYQNAWRAETPRSQAEAQERAEQIRNWALEGYDFGLLALKYSDDPTQIQKGYLGIIEKGEMIPEFEDALFALDYNEISDIVETGFGYHIVQRLPLKEAELTHILVQWKGAARATTERTKEEAQKICQTIEQELKTIPPTTVAERYSDGPMGSRGGYLGWMEAKGLDAEFSEVIFRLLPNQCSGALEGQHGFHFFCVHKKSP